MPFALFLLICHLRAVHLFNPYPAGVIYLNFQPLEVVSRYRDPQLQMGENYAYCQEYVFIIYS